MLWNGKAEVTSVTTLGIFYQKEEGKRAHRHFEAVQALQARAPWFFCFVFNRNKTLKSKIPDLISVRSQESRLHGDVLSELVVYFILVHLKKTACRHV